MVDGAIARERPGFEDHLRCSRQPVAPNNIEHITTHFFKQEITPLKLIAAALAGIIVCASGAMAQSVCKVDGVSYPATVAGIQQAIDNTSCQEIVLLPGTYPGVGSSPLVINRSNIYIHGSRGTGLAGSSSLGTKLNFTMAGTGVIMGDSSANIFDSVTFEGITVAMPTGSASTALLVKPNAVGGQVRQSRFTEWSGNSAGTGVDLEYRDSVDSAYMWTFDNVVVDHFQTGYHLRGANHWLNIHRGQINNNYNGLVTEAAMGSQDVLLEAVTVEGNINIGVDIKSGFGFKVDGCFFDTGAGAGALGVRVGQGGGAPNSVQIKHNTFLGHNITNYAIEADYFNALTIEDNTFQSYLLYNVRNLFPTSDGGQGWFGNNNTFGLGNGSQISSINGFQFVANGGVANANSTIMRLARPRLGGDQVSNNSFSVSPSWGSSYSLGVTDGSKDTGGQVGILPWGTGISQGALVTLNFQNGSWGAAPFCVVGISGGGDATHTGMVRVSSTSSTQLNLYWEGTPVAGLNMYFTWICVASN